MNKITKQRTPKLAILLFISSLLAGCTSAADPVEISVQDAAKQRDSGAFILDVRQPEEWEQAHIPGATLIPLGELETRLTELPKDQEIVVVCRSGNRSLTGANLLRSKGFSTASSMVGGMNQWSAAGYPTESGK